VPKKGKGCVKFAIDDIALWVNNPSQQEDTVYMITQGDIREEAQSYLGRELTEEELYVVTSKFWKALEWLDWSQYLC
jgi:hypothetical protein